MLLPVTNIQRFSTHDGPGVRTTVFLKGCPLRCKWCHNPETQSCRQQIFYTSKNCIGCSECVKVCPTGALFFDEVGTHRFNVLKCTGCLNCTTVCPAKAVEPVSKWMTVEEIFDVVLKDKVFYGAAGGMTLSGGEPLLHAEGCLELLKLARENGISTAIETSGYFDEAYIEPLTKLTDLFLWDFKDGNLQRHVETTGVSNEKILHNLFLTDEKDTRILLRSTIVKGINMDDNHLHEIAKIVSRLKHCIGVELLPYHAYGGSKNEQLGYEDNGRQDWIPTADEMRIYRERLRHLLAECSHYQL
jgi:pyruvate formate lyase activating enzyme